MRWALILILLASSLFAQEATRFELKPDELPARGNYWYGFYMGKNKIGWVRETVKRTAEGHIVAAYEMRMQMSGPGGVVKMHMQQDLFFDSKPPYRLHSGAGLHDMGGGATQTKLKRGEKGYEATISTAGGTRKVAVEIDYVLADHIGVEVWIQRGELKVGDKFTTRSFDMDELEVGTDTFTLKETRKAMVGGVRQLVYIAHVSSSKMGDIGTARATANGRLLSIVLGGSLEVRREPEAIAKQPAAAVDMFALSSLPLDKPLGDPKTITELVLEVSGSAADRLKNGTRQTVTPGDKPGTVLVKLGAGHGGEIKATAEETEDALKVSREYPARDEQVVAMAKTAVGDAATPREKVARLVTHVAKYIEDEYGPEYLTALDVIRAKRGDCSAHAKLFVALARALGIPSREAGGLMYAGDELQVLAGHAWCEVVLDGRWVEVDPTWDEVEINPTHLSFRGKNPELEWLKIVGSVKLRVVSIKREE